MSSVQKLLKEFATAKSKFFELRDGEEKTVSFIGAETVPNHFDGGKTTCIRFHLESNGAVQAWDRVSRGLALQMSAIPTNSLIKIRRTGDKSKTKYFVEVVQ
jgi:hypothetical protein